MSQAPPKFLTVKRKATQDPVEALRKSIASFIVRCSSANRFGIDFEDLSSNRPTKRVHVHPYDGYIYKLQQVRDSNSKLSKDEIISDRRATGALAGPPTLLATKPGEEDRPIRNLRTPQRATSIAQAGNNDSKPENAPQTIPRRFHLTQPLSGSTVSRKRKLDVATFTEAPNIKRIASHAGLPIQSAQDTEMTDDTISKSPPRKRPGASEAEKKWRAEQVGKQKQGQSNAPPKAVDTSSETVEKLERLAHDVVKAELQENAKSQAFTSTRFKPKVPAQRYKDRGIQQAKSHGDDTVMVLDDPDDQDFVYDTYVRHYDPSIVGSVDGPSTASIGLLVIGQEERELWETYLTDDGGDDKEFETDEEDENGEPVIRPLHM